MLIGSVDESGEMRRRRHWSRAVKGSEAVAAIAGRGFNIRHGDLKKLLIATRGKVFALQNMGRLIEYTRAGKFKTR